MYLLVHLISAEEALRPVQFLGTCLGQMNWKGRGERGLAKRLGEAKWAGQQASVLAQLLYISEVIVMDVTRAPKVSLVLLLLGLVLRLKSRSFLLSGGAEGFRESSNPIRDESCINLTYEGVIVTTLSAN